MNCQDRDGRPSIKETDGKKDCFLNEIISNARNGIDCEKFGYLMRDSNHIVWECIFDCIRYFKTADIVEYEKNLHIAVRDKGKFALYELFQLRYALYHQACHHRITKGIEAMICDALSWVDDEMGTFDSRDDLAANTYLANAIIDEICRKN